MLIGTIQSTQPAVDEALARLAAEPIAGVILQLWWIVSATLVLFMIFGFLLFETGLVDKKHQESIAVKNVCMFFTSTLAYLLFGVHLMYGESFHGLIGIPLTLDPQYDIPSWIFYQAGFAAVTATIISGAIAGRTTLFANVLCAALLAGVIFPIHGHWVWHHEGWLHSMNDAAQFKVIDYAGSGAVHFVGGIAALTGCYIVGRGKMFGQSIERAPHLAAGGVLLLMIGWIGFNGGNISGTEEMFKAVRDPQAVGFSYFLTAGRYAYFTVLAGCAGAGAGFVVSLYYRYKDDPTSYLFDQYAILTSAMAGMVAITAVCDQVGRTKSLLVGIAGGAFACWVSRQMKMKWKLDDSVDAVAVHAGGGFIGMLAAGLLSHQLVNQMAQQLISQAIDLIACSLLTVGVIGVTLLLLKWCPPMGNKRLLLVADAEQAAGITYEPHGRFGRINKPAIFVALPVAILGVTFLFLRFKTPMTAVAGAAFLCLTVLEIRRLLSARTSDVVQSLRIAKDDGVCGGHARIRRTRIPVWTLVEYRNLGATVRDLLSAYSSLDSDDLRAAWEHELRHKAEIEEAIASQDVDKTETD